MNYREQGKLEIGYQYTSYSEHGDYNITYWDRAAQDFQWQDDLYAPFFYRRQIHSLYAMLNDRIGPVAFDAGLRADNTLDELAISVAGADRDISRLELFPSLHASYEAPHGNTFSVGYSYRTNRPGVSGSSNPISPTRITTPSRSEIPTSGPSTFIPSRRDTGKARGKAAASRSPDSSGRERA